MASNISVNLKRISVTDKASSSGKTVASTTAVGSKANRAGLAFTKTRRASSEKVFGWTESAKNGLMKAVESDTLINSI